MTNTTSSAALRLSRIPRDLYLAALDDTEDPAPCPTRRNRIRPAIVRWTASGEVRSISLRPGQHIDRL